MAVEKTWLDSIPCIIPESFSFVWFVAFLLFLQCVNLRIAME